ncbi:MAG: DUF2410 domain-containing protein [Candidatus Muirbacterium halophilum]|nr:DUF2410 domain-containing protein [Candidatus Muirbacterium halophilum]
MKLISYDFDGTLFLTPEPNVGKIIWKEKTGLDYPHRGWWSKIESLDTEIFNIYVNEKVYNQYIMDKKDPNNIIILATGRLDKVPEMRESVEKILNKYNIIFDDIYLNYGINTFYFKIKLFEKLIKTHNIKEFTMYDDREEHIAKFVDWAKTQIIPINIIDVINEKKYINYVNSK